MKEDITIYKMILDMTKAIIAEDEEAGTDVKMATALVGITLKSGELADKLANKLGTIEVEHLLNNILMIEKVLEETEKEIDRLLKEAK